MALTMSNVHHPLMLVNTQTLQAPNHNTTSTLNTALGLRYVRHGRPLRGVAHPNQSKPQAVPHAIVYAPDSLDVAC